MMIAGKRIEEWQLEYPLLTHVIRTEEVCWTNEDCNSDTSTVPMSAHDIQEAEERLQRFAPYIRSAFPETENANGQIESPLVSIPHMKQELEAMFHVHIQGTMLLKLDSHLPISGSVKARGGIYEVLKHAETLAVQHGLLAYTDDYSILHSEPFRELYSRYSIAVGSTGNLGLSIGMISAKLGFQTTVHMSADAKEWKKDLLREKGVVVKEYEADYSKAVEVGRQEALQNPFCHFVDDERSTDLFAGYATAAKRLKRQLDEQGVHVDEQHPLFVYLPCGVGGAPGGITFGLKLVFGAHVHCFFAEPTHSPCMLIGLMTGLHDTVSVQDFGIDNRTEADGLAVGSSSRFVGEAMTRLVSGIYTVEDERLFALLRALADTEHIRLEPSALAGMYGPVQLCRHADYVQTRNLMHKMDAATHVVWATGGSMVPDDIMKQYYERG